MNYNGIFIGLISFLIIGVFHPIVIKGEYYFSKKIWPIFLVMGLIFIILSLMVKNYIVSTIMGVVGFSCIWSIHEIIEQEERVRKGWFPKNNKRNK